MAMPIKEIEKLVESECKKDTNYFGYGIWTHHILNVVYYAKKMAKTIGADEEIVEIAALLHDYASIKDYKMYEDHHIHGANEAEQILKTLDYPIEKIENIKHCIISHRGSKVAQKQTKEALCVADADSMAHFDSIPSLFYLAFNSHKMDIDEAKKWILGKLERRWNKLSPQAQNIIKNKYESSKVLLNDHNKQ